MKIIGSLSERVGWKILLVAFGKTVPDSDGQNNGNAMSDTWYILQQVVRAPMLMRMRGAIMRMILKGESLQ